MTQLEFNYQVKEHYRPLKGYALKLTQDAEDANDLVQETMLKAFHNKDKFAEGTNLKGWLYTIMKNIFINNYRRMVKGGIFSDDTEEQVHLHAGNRQERNLGEHNILRKEIHSAIDKLTENLKTPFMMSYEGYKYEEIAQYLSVPLGTVKIRIHVARQKLKKALSVYGEQNGFSMN